MCHSISFKTSRPLTFNCSFGFLDGISQPAIKDVDTNPDAGQEIVPQGTILLGREGDATPTGPITRPSWALDGSFLAFRYLFQLVPEFDTFLKQNPIPGPPPNEGSELLGARLVGRWKSGAPVDLAPIKDEPGLATDPSKRNNFDYSFPDGSQRQDRCPFAGHTRKMNPRAGLSDAALQPHRIVRRGVQFGPEVSHEEETSHKTIHGRGLLFAAYQSNLAQGFHFLQQSKSCFYLLFLCTTSSFKKNQLTSPLPSHLGWANNTGFPFNRPANITPGFDPIIGQDANPTARELEGWNPNSQSTELKLSAQWVVPKGGEYFFSPSLVALKEIFAAEKKA